MIENARQEQDAALLLEQVRVVRRHTRSELQAYWFPLLVFGVLLLGSSPFFRLLDGAGVALYWLVAGPLGSIAVARHYRDRSADLGVTRFHRPYSRLVVALFLACFGLGFAGGITGADAIAEIGPPVAIACAYLAFAWIERSVLLALLACCLGAFSAALAVSDIVHPGPILALVYGASFIGVGLAARTRVRAR